MSCEQRKELLDFIIRKKESLNKSNNKLTVYGAIAALYLLFQELLKKESIDTLKNINSEHLVIITFLTFFVIVGATVAVICMITYFSKDSTIINKALKINMQPLPSHYFISLGIFPSILFALYPTADLTVLICVFTYFVLLVFTFIYIHNDNENIAIIVVPLALTSCSILFCICTSTLHEGLWDDLPKVVLFPIKLVAISATIITLLNLLIYYIPIEGQLDALEKEIIYENLEVNAIKELYKNNPYLKHTGKKP